MATLALTDVLGQALNVLGILDSGGAANISSQQKTDALAIVNQLIGNKSVDRLMAASATLTSVSLVAATQSYTLGTRVSNIESAALKLANGLTMPVEIVNGVKWAMIPDRDHSSYLVKYLFYDRGSTAKIYVSPIPLGGTLEFVSWAAMTQFADTTTAITMQEGYSRWLILASAIELAPTYPSAQLTAGILQDYADATANLRNLNASLFGAGPAAGQVASNATPPAVIQPTVTEAA